MFEKPFNCTIFNIFAALSTLSLLDQRKEKNFIVLCKQKIYFSKIIFSIFVPLSNIKNNYKSSLSIP